MNASFEVLKKIGLSEKEIKIYLSALEFGPTSVAVIAKKAGVKRTSIYNFLEDMINRGFIISSAKGKKVLYSAKEPEGLVDLIEKQKELIASVVPDLSLLLGKGGGARPKIRFYEGVEGLKAVYNDSINQPDGGMMLFISSFEDIVEALPPSFVDNFLKRKVKKKILSRGVIPSGEHATEHTQNNKKEMRESIVIARKELPITGELFIYQNKVAITSPTEEKISIIIESQEIADTQRAIFNSYWKALKLLEKNGIKLG